MASGKIVKRIGEKKWVNPKSGKDVFFVSIELDNGDKGEVWCNASGELKEGESIPDYTIEPREGKASSIKITRSVGSSGGFAKKAWVPEDVESRIASTSFSYAKDLCVAGKIESKQMVQTAELIAIGIQTLTAKLKTTAPKPADDAKV